MDLTKLTDDEFIKLISSEPHSDVGLLEISEYQDELHRRLKKPQPSGDVGNGMPIAQLHQEITALQASEAGAWELVGGLLSNGTWNPYDLVKVKSISPDKPMRQCIYCCAIFPDEGELECTNPACPAVRARAALEAD